LREGLDRLAGRIPLVEAVLFGSFATGRQTVGSDIDVLIVYKGVPRDDVFALAKQEIAVPRLEPHVYSDEEAARLSELIGRMTRNGIRLYPPAA